MARYSLSEFVTRTAQQDRGQGLFELENERLLEINLNGMAWTKTGSMVAYLGQIKFTREGVLEHGVGKFLKKALTGEGTRLTKAEGAGKLYLADKGKKITVLQLADDVAVRQRQRRAGVRADAQVGHQDDAEGHRDGGRRAVQRPLRRARACSRSRPTTTRSRSACSPG